jgi:hypothetical protein
MGYTTEFEGSFQITPTLKEEHKQYLLAFSDTRRMKRSADKCLDIKDPIRQAVELPIGIEGEFTVFGEGFSEQEESILNYNMPPKTQPGLWCQWVPTDDGSHLEWNGAEKFYSYLEWLEYLKVNFLEPWGYTLSGTATWAGQEYNDKGIITINDNIITSKKGKY